MAKEHSFISRKSLRLRLILYVFALLVTQFMVIFGAFFILKSLPEDISGIYDSDEDIFSYAFRGPVSMIRNHLSDPFLSPQQALDQLQPDFTYPLKLIPKDTPLSKEVLRQFQTDDLALDEGEYIIYATLPDEPSMLLALGPVIDPTILEDNQTSFLILTLLWSIFSFIITSTLLYFALFPLWRDAMSIRHTAEQLSCGHLQTRAPKARTWLFKPLANILNDMAIQIERLFNNSKITLHAMAHELRTPLTRLRFALGILDEATTEQEYNNYRKDIDHDIEELEDLINLILGLFRMQQNGVVLNREFTSLHEWGEELCDTLESFKPEHFNLKYNAQDSIANFDIKIVNLAVNNLLLNAFKYASSCVELTIYQEDGMVKIEVEDDGAGIPEDSREIVFVPFSRLDNSRTRSTGGHGLGLAYVKLIAELHYGSVHITTSKLGGCKFILTLDEKEAEEN